MRLQMTILMNYTKNIQKDKYMNKSILAIALSTTVVLGFDFGNILNETIKSVKTSQISPQSTSGILDNLTISNGLKEALKVGVDYGVKTLSKDGGYLNNMDVKIPIPKNLETAESIIRKAGGEQIIDDLILSMNKAASEAAPKTAKIFVDAIDKMSLKDSKSILSGDDTAATKFFEKHTSQQLKDLIKPIIKKSMEDNKVATYYDTFNGFYKSNVKTYVDNSSVMQMAQSYGVDKFIPQNSDVRLDDYVTQGAIDGLFKIIAQKEKEIRKNPVAQTTSLLKKVFGN